MQVSREAEGTAPEQWIEKKQFCTAKVKKPYRKIGLFALYDFLSAEIQRFFMPENEVIKL